MPNIEDVFKRSGIPTYTFVEPDEYQQIKISIRTKGRGLVVEGPSGIGKSTCVKKAISELQNELKIVELNARKTADIPLIEALPDMGNIGIVIVDDFHVLPDPIKERLANFMKLLAEEEDANSKLVIIGINKAGDSLVRFARDLNNRIDTITLERNSESKLLMVISKGEETLNIRISTRNEIAKLSWGSFHLVQLLCYEYCVSSGIEDTQSEMRPLNTSIELVKERVLSELARVFYEYVREFAIGSKLKRAGRAPYLHLLKWLSESESWSIQMDEIMLAHPNHKGSITQIIEKKFLISLLDNKPDLKAVLHFDAFSKRLTIEDPKFLFYLKELLWLKVANDIGFSNIDFTAKYDFALSFAGEQREIAKRIFEKLAENELEVFYDHNEQSRILANNVEDYLAPIYRSEAIFVIVILSKDYPKKIWTTFESENFKHRFGDKSVIPFALSDVVLTQFDITTNIGQFRFDINAPQDPQLDEFVKLVTEKITEKRTEPN